MHELRTYRALVAVFCSAAVTFLASAEDSRTPETALAHVQSKASAAALYRASYDATDEIAERRGLDCHRVRTDAFAVVSHELMGRGAWSSATNSVTGWYAHYGLSAASADRLLYQCRRLARSYGIASVGAWARGLGRPELDGRQPAESGAGPDAGAGGQEQAGTGSE